MKGHGYVEDGDYFIKDGKVLIKKSGETTSVSSAVESELKRSIWKEKYHRKVSRSVSMEKEIAPGLKVGDTIGKSESFEDRTAESVIFGLRSLTTKEREVLWLFYEAGLNDREIGLVTKESQQTINYRRNRALKKARDEMMAEIKNQDRER